MVQSAGDLLQSLPKNVSKEFSDNHAQDYRENTQQKSDPSLLVARYKEKEN